MQKAKKVVIGFFIIALLVIAGLYISYTIKLDKKTTDINYSNQTVLFYSLTCPHCKIVEAFITENNITDKIVITQLEVSLNKTNADFLIKQGKECNIDPNYVGAIPLLYSQGKCYLGDTPIIEFLNKSINNN